MLPTELWVLLLGLVMVGVWSYQRKTLRKSASFTGHYFSGLNYLLNDQDDKAVAVFIEMLAVDSDTVEMHLTLGSLFRRRGEVDKAIRIHQNLIARPQLTTVERYEALLALGRDYLTAGVLDRAERIFEQCIKANNEQSIQAMNHLLDIYQQEKSWLQAIEIARKIHQRTKQSMHLAIAHHYCELAEQALINNAEEDVKRYISKALSSDANSVRAHLLQARYEQYKCRPKAAMEIYQKIIKKSPHYLSEVILDLFACYVELDMPQQALKFIKSIEHSQTRLEAAMLMVHHLRDQQTSDELIELLHTRLCDHPSLVGLAQLLSLYQSSRTLDPNALEQIQKVVYALLAKEPHYRCAHCGFVSRKITWYCPGCKRWNTIQPLPNHLTCLLNGRELALSERK